MKTKLYIAYGSNMDEGQMAFRCPKAKLKGVSEVKDCRLIFKGSKTGAYATIEKAKGQKVPVVLWEIEPTDEHNLDRYEGFPTFYYKQWLELDLDGEKIQGMVYMMDHDRKLGQPSYHYYKTLEDAYEKFGFDKAILEKALEDSSVEGDEDVN
ncbi:gamma-glutamylcyclotransferase family protein [Alkaliphilus transvaalensis]|uniref:gamma-glutamylcyclotransferase family protein n=1 Tax=Alkaliphilus transvaalensis TaxID=114628 RepID=UPI0004793544|nr:gamma-glutamylcyclotransferase family protein [Alkaliphilus transvaalensis]